MSDKISRSCKAFLQTLSILLLLLYRDLFFCHSLVTISLCERVTLEDMAIAVIVYLHTNKHIGESEHIAALPCQ